MKKEMIIPSFIPINACISCGGKLFTYKYDANIDNTFTDGRIYCASCSLSKGNQSGDGMPIAKTIIDTARIWNSRSVNFIPTPKVSFTEAFQPGYQIVPIASPAMQKGQSMLMMNQEDHDYFVESLKKQALEEKEDEDA